jgi:hypothetical protein
MVIIITAVFLLQTIVAQQSTAPISNTPQPTDDLQRKNWSLLAVIAITIGVNVFIIAAVLVLRRLAAFLQAKYRTWQKKLLSEDYHLS